MAKSNLFDDETTQSESNDFATLFEQSLSHAGRKLAVGDKFSGQLLSLGKEQGFISTSTARDAIISASELLDENKNPKWKVGDRLDVVVTRVKGDEVWVTRQGSKTAPVEIENLEDAFDMELPVEGKVIEIVNGGYRVTLHGQPAFCPISQMDLRPVQDPTSLIGKRFEFIITQFDPSKRNIVVSRRKLLELKRAENEGQWMESHQPGDILSGRVSRVESFGAFVEIGEGIEGLVHISELSFGRLKHASEAVTPGDPVQVKVLKVQDEDGRLKISLSIKQAGGLADPWVEVLQKLPVGTVLEGTVEKREPYGLFVRLTPAITGLLPKSKWRDSVEAQSFENKKKGDKIQVRVDEVKYEERKISLGLPSEVDDPSWKEHVSNQKLGTLAAAFASAKRK